jgi:superfamily II DNA/RNA helicase
VFDPVTVGLIRQAPPLDGLNLDALPQLLTDAFATVVAARIQLRTSAPAEVRSSLQSTIALLIRLAEAQEVFVAQLPNRENRAAAAFVGGTARQTLLLADVDKHSDSRIGASTISPEISAALLFLVAESYPDAAEAAKRIIPPSADSSTLSEQRLVRALRGLARGRLSEAASEPIPERPTAASTEGAVEALLSLLLQGVQALAVEFSGTALNEGTARRLFQRVKELAVSEMPSVLGDESLGYSVLSGPLHLANLLLAVERDLREAAVSLIPPPTGIAPSEWRALVQRIARSRPFLWRNHREAIAQGYLEPGRSAAISFPTGAGKSTLSELKIAATLLLGKRVVFLAPTNALVAQTVSALKATFVGVSVFADLDDDASLYTSSLKREIIVTTPERCLMLQGARPEALEGLGLIVFDECHLLHAQPSEHSRRGLDAMLCLLNLTLTAPQADLLLVSAMMKNTSEVASWLSAVTGRDCLALDLAWKPTRQVRGCVVYDRTQIDALKDLLKDASRNYPMQKSAPISVKKLLTAQPRGLFSLRQTWLTRATEDYALRSLLETPEPLAVSGGRPWRLTPNGNAVGTAIAAGAVTAGMKTLVFVQSIAASAKCVRDLDERVKRRTVRLTAEEISLRTRVVEEMGGEEHCYLKVGTGGEVQTSATNHHALLLRDERELHESLFRRSDGIDALFATSTLAQGMNLPSEVVVICGDSRFDPNEDKLERLEAHELLNAAGRAGRAGESSQGLVVVVPSEIVEFDEQDSTIGSRWMELQSIFGQSDQCLDIDDPLEAALDQIHNGLTQDGSGAYLLGRLPLFQLGSQSDPADLLLRRSLAVHRRAKAGDEIWVSSRISAALAARPTSLDEDRRWLGLIASSTGLRVETLDSLLAHVDSESLDGDANAAMTSLLSWMGSEPSRLFELMRPSSIQGLFGAEYSRLTSDDDRSAMALKRIQLVLPVWMAGRPLCEIESTMQGGNTKMGFCKTARHFAMRVVPELSFIAGLPFRLLSARDQVSTQSSRASVTTVLVTLAGLVREGCDSPEALAVRIIAGRSVSRVAARRIFESAFGTFAVGSPTEEFDETLARARRAVEETASEK